MSWIWVEKGKKIIGNPSVNFLFSSWCILLLALVRLHKRYKILLKYIAACNWWISNKWDVNVIRWKWTIFFFMFVGLNKLEGKFKSQVEIINLWFLYRKGVSPTWDDIEQHKTYAVNISWKYNWSLIKMSVLMSLSITTLLLQSMQVKEPSQESLEENITPFI